MEVTLPFHRKYRPNTIAGYIGNKGIKEKSLRAVSSPVRPQVLLYSGQAGCGKTTMARLMAKEYVCEDRDLEKGACGQCYSCREMDYFIETGDSGNLMNVQEIDVTDSNKRQDIDRLLEDASQPDITGNWKVYILDECHMMTNTAQNRLLKNLEEPAEKVLMILCTTNPEKLLETIISRCQYNFKVTKPNNEDLSALLARVCKAEGVEYDAKGLSLVCVAGDFVPRKSLTSLERVVRQVGKVTYSDTLQVLDLTATKLFFEFYNYLLKSPIDIKSYIVFLSKVKAQVDLSQFVDDLLAFTKRGIYIYSGVNTESLDTSEVTTYSKLFSQFSVADLGNTLSTLLEIKTSGDQETRLILLGYLGLRAKDASSSQSPASPQELAALLDDQATTVAGEKDKGDAMLQSRMKMTEKENSELIERSNALVNAQGLAEMFTGGVVGSEKK